jgi:hypothetical protein
MGCLDAPNVSMFWEVGVVLLILAFVPPFGRKIRIGTSSDVSLASCVLDWVSLLHYVSFAWSLTSMDFCRYSPPPRRSSRSRSRSPSRWLTSAIPPSLLLWKFHLFLFGWLSSALQCQCRQFSFLRSSVVWHKPLLQLASTCLVVLWCRSYRERHEDVENPGNNLYVTGLSIRVTEKDLEKYFAKVGEVRLQVKLDKFDWSQWHKSKCPTIWFVRIFWWLPGLPTVQGALSVYQVEFGLIPGFLNLQVIEARLVVDPRTRESRGFGFVTMSRVKDADRCIRHLHGSTLEGRIITVEKVRTAWLQTNGNFWWQHGIYSHEKLQLGCKQREYTGVALSLGVLVAWPCSCVLCQAWFSFAISLWGITGLGLDNPCSVWCVVFSKGLTTSEARRNAEETYRVSHQVSKVCYFSWQIVTSQLDFEISNSRRSSPQAKAQVNPT